jgi:toxin ParE1/3/4
MRIRWPRRAERSLGHIASYVADNPVAAHATILKIQEAAESLAYHPQMRRPGRVEGTRELVVMPCYILPYRIKDDQVRILHVFHVARRCGLTAFERRQGVAPGASHRSRVEW